MRTRDFVFIEKEKTKTKNTEYQQINWTSEPLQQGH